MSDPIEIWHIEGRRSLRVVWLCEELGLPYTLRFDRGDIFGSLMAIRKAHPFMPVAPAVRMGDDWMVETGGILQLLLARHGDGRLAPDPQSDDFASHAQWMHFAEGTAATRLMAERAVASSLGVEIDTLPEGYRAPGKGGARPKASGEPQLLTVIVGSHGVFDFMEEHLAAHPYFGGAEFTAADIMMHFPVQIAELISWIDLETFPAIARWRQKVEDRPAYVRALAAAVPDGANRFGQRLDQPLPFAERPA